MTEIKPFSDPLSLPGAGSEVVPSLLESLLRKAAVDAGFDLEPEIDGDWWRLRASGASGVAWVRPSPDGARVWLALPLAEQITVASNDTRNTDSDTALRPVMPAGAAGAAAFDSPEALYVALRRVWAHRAYTPERLRARWVARVADALGVAADPTSVVGDASLTVATTEVVASIKRRVGQELYREALLEVWDGRCAVSGLAVSELLRASHAKPWADATDAERLDPFNGLLLAVHFDALFDRGFLTFDETGGGAFSSALTSEHREQLGLPKAPPRLRRIHPEHQPYLAWHRAHVFRP